MAKNDAQSFPDQAETALLIIDAINDLEFDGGERMLESALPMAEAIATLKRHTTAAGIPTIYLNDNFGQWRSDFRTVVRQNLDGVRGSPIVRLLVPAEDDYFVLKPKHSGFFDTTLQTLLRFIGVKRLILTGLTTDMCVLFTAIDAHMRDYDIAVPADCCAASAPAHHAQALAYLARVLNADVRTSEQMEWSQE
jgi:nicotinamidase-related amidase